MHTVIVNGRVIKHDHALIGIDLPAVRREVESTVEHLRSELGEEAWIAGMDPRSRDEGPRQPVHHRPTTSSATHATGPSRTPSAATARHVPVLVVGGGLVGLSTSVLLAHQRAALLVEYHSGTAIHPGPPPSTSGTMEVLSQSASSRRSTRLPRSSS